MDAKFEGKAASVDDLLTTKQLQDLLQVDRITIYRMLNDGRLRGFKVGGQWRFSRREIERWLQGQRADLEAGQPTFPLDDQDISPLQALSLSCVQAIQGLCADALDVATVTIDLRGNRLTEVSNSCEFCNLVLSTDAGHRRCTSSWHKSDSGQAQPCHAGLLCVGRQILVDEQPIAFTAGCQFATQAWQPDLSALANDIGLDRQDLESALASVRFVPEGSLPRISRLLQREADTFSEIGHERLKLLSRLQHIAEMSRI
jgi:excisionase family DNA binding protein